MLQLSLPRRTADGFQSLHGFVVDSTAQGGKYFPLSMQSTVA